MKKMLKHVVFALGFIAVGCAGPAEEGDDNDNDNGTGEEQAEVASAQSCINIVGHTSYVEITTRYHKVTVKNTCGSTKKVTLDLALYPDPKCKSVGNGQSVELTYAHDKDIGVNLRRAKTC